MKGLRQEPDPTLQIYGLTTNYWKVFENCNNENIEEKFQKH